MSTTQSNLGEIFGSLASQLGIDPELPEIKTILSNEKLKEITVEEETANKFKSGFLTMSAAKNNPELNKFFMAKHLSTVDSKMKSQLTKLGIPQELSDEAFGIEKTSERIDFLFPKLQEHFKTTYEKPAPDGTKLKEVTDKYNALVAEKATLATQLENEKKGWLTEREGLEVSFERKNLLAGYTFSDAYKREDVELLVSNKVGSLPYVFKKKADGTTGVFQKDTPDLEATKENKILTMKDVLDEVVMPYVKKSGKAGDPPPAGQKKDIPEGTKLNPNAKAADSELEKFEKILAGEKVDS